MTAHLGPLPLEEVLPALAGAGSALLAARAWVAVRLRRARVGDEAGFDGPPQPE